jgi:hypothetical protein
MLHPDQMRAILDRRSQIADEIARLQAEDNELQIALKILGKYTGLGSGAGPPSESKLGPKRPPEIPNLFVMTTTVIKEAIEGGKQGLKGRDIVTAIGAKYWPGVKAEQILPQIYVFKKKGRLRKDASGFFKLTN